MNPRKPGKRQPLDSRKRNNEGCKEHVRGRHHRAVTGYQGAVFSLAHRSHDTVKRNTGTGRPLRDALFVTDLLVPRFGGLPGQRWTVGTTIPVPLIGHLASQRHDGVARLRDACPHLADVHRRTAISEQGRDTDDSDNRLDRAGPQIIAGRRSIVGQGNRGGALPKSRLSATNERLA